MRIDLATVESLAPDQAALRAASKLTKPTVWPELATDENRDLIWGACQGSGSNPYRVVADLRDHGSKCTCPSRKFPCKHALALMWIGADNPGAFAPDTIPDWVTEWLGRRRKMADSDPRPAADGPWGKRPAADGPWGKRPAADGPWGKRSIDRARAVAPPEIDDPIKVERRQAAAAKRADDTRRAVEEGLDELDQWISDQLRLGLDGFLADLNTRCRRIAARMVDLKATALAGRIDEIPSRILPLRGEERPDAAISELGKLVLLAKAWRAAPDDPELRRLVSSAETREQVLSDPAAVRHRSTWEVLAERFENRRDGLVSHGTWLLDVAASTPRFALLLDFYPTSARKRGNAFTAGERFDAELVFYPARVPLRALIAERTPGLAGPANGWPTLIQSDSDDPLASVAIAEDEMPWALELPVLLGPGRLATDGAGAIWWQSGNGSANCALPLAAEVPGSVMGFDLQSIAGLWNGSRLLPLAALSAFGRVDF